MDSASMNDLRTQLKPYGDIPIDLQLQLLRDRDRRDLQPFAHLCRDLVDLCLESPSARFPVTSLPSVGTHYILLDQNGWHLHPWRFTTQDHALEEFSREIYGSMSSLRWTEEVYSYVSDPAVVLHANANGVNERLPIFAGVKMSEKLPGYLFSGPIIVTGAHSGLTSEQMRTVQREVFSVDEALGQGIADLWYYGLQTIDSRPRENG